MLTNPAIARAAKEADSKGRSLAFIAASFFCNFHHVKRMWRKRVGADPKTNGIVRLLNRLSSHNQIGNSWASLHVPERRFWTVASRLTSV